MFIQTYPEFHSAGVSASPGVCYFCGTHRRAEEEAVLSTGVAIHMEGMLELCRACVLEMASHFGAIAPEKAAQLRETNRRLGAQLRASLAVQDSQARQVEALTDQVEALRDALKK